MEIVRELNRAPDDLSVSHPNDAEEVRVTLTQELELASLAVVLAVTFCGTFAIVIGIGWPWIKRGRS